MRYTTTYCELFTFPVWFQIRRQDSGVFSAIVAKNEHIYLMIRHLFTCITRLPSGMIPDEFSLQFISQFSLANELEQQNSDVE